MAGMGIFKGAYRGSGIYWDGRDGYTTDSFSGCWDSLPDVRAAIDRHVADMAADEAREKAGKLAAGAIRATREGDTVTLDLPDGPQTITIRRYRQTVYDLEEKYGREIVIA